MYTFKQNKEHAKFRTGEDISKASNKPSAGYRKKCSKPEATLIRLYKSWQVMH